MKYTLEKLTIKKLINRNAEKTESDFFLLEFLHDRCWQLDHMSKGFKIAFKA